MLCLGFVVMRCQPLRRALTARRQMLQDIITYLVSIDSSLVWVAIIIVFISPLIKELLNLFVNKVSIDQKNLELLLSVSSRESNTYTDVFIIERVISSMYKLKIPICIINSLIQSKSPMRSFELYKRVKPYLKITKKRKPFRRKYKYPRLIIFKRTIWYWVSFQEMFFYFLAMFSSLILLMVNYYMLTNLKGSLTDMIPTFIIIVFMSMFAVFFFIIGMHFLNRCGNIRFLQEFLEMQLTNASRGTVNASRFQSH
ncbi:hypothetical protein DDM94_18040 [Vibrio cholerae]|nr:hypothetical protein [Vibrio cholerae]